MVMNGVVDAEKFFTSSLTKTGIFIALSITNGKSSGTG